MQIIEQKSLLSALLLAEAPEAVKRFVAKFPNSAWEFKAPVKNIDFFIFLKWFIVNISNNSMAADGLYGIHKKAFQSKVVSPADRESLARSMVFLARLQPPLEDILTSSRELPVATFVNAMAIMPPFLQTQTLWATYEANLKKLKIAYDAKMTSERPGLPAIRDLDQLIDDAASIKSAFEVITKQIMVTLPPPVRPAYIEKSDVEVSGPA